MRAAEARVLRWLCGVQEIADLLQVAPQTVSNWRTRGLFPEPDRVLSRTDIWLGSTVERWAKKTGRWPHEEGADG